MDNETNLKSAYDSLQKKELEQRKTIKQMSERIKELEALVSKNESLHDVSYSLLNKRIDKWIEESDKNAEMCDGISSVMFTSYSQAYWNVKQFIEVNEN